MFTYLIDCSGTNYEVVSVATAPFRICNLKNFGLSELCSLDKQIFQPSFWAKDAKAEVRCTDMESHIKSIKSNIRQWSLEDQEHDVFRHRVKKLPTNDAFSNDIGVVNFYCLPYKFSM